MDRIVFYLEITNIDSSMIQIDPVTICYTYENNAQNNEDQKKEYKIYAKNPEKEIERIDQKIEQENSSYSTSSTFNAVSGLLNAVGSIVSLFTKDEEEEETTDKDEEESYDPEQARLEHEAKIEGLEIEKDYWQNDVLRKTTLFKDKHTAGFIEFSLVDDISGFTVQIPVDTLIASFAFKQQWQEL